MNFSNIISPLDQFEIRNLVSLDAPVLGNLSISLTNIGLYLTIAGVLVFTISLLSNNNNRVVSNAWSVYQESIYATVHSIVVSQINDKKGQVYFPFMYVLFLFILVNNLIGMVPYSFASTSHFALTFSLSFTIVLGATILGFSKHGLQFFSLFVPAGCPLGLLPLLVLIEFISYLARNVSLGLRLAANILSGHMLLNILSGFTYNIMTSGFIYFFLGFFPLAFIIAFSGLEFFSLFVPAGCPLGLLPLLVLIEFISYLARNVSLGLRLAANILSGHMLLNILSGFTYNIMTSGFIFFFLGFFPLAFIIAFSGLELGIAFIQSQVFVVLTCSYIKDSLDLH